MVITRQAADDALRALEIDALGLDPVDRRMLSAIIDNYRGGPVGLETLAATIGEEAVTLEDVYEPYLMQLGFLTRTPRGRCVTEKACRHLGRALPGALASPASSEGMEQLAIDVPDGAERAGRTGVGMSGETEPTESSAAG